MQSLVSQIGSMLLVVSQIVSELLGVISSESNRFNVA